MKIKIRHLYFLMLVASMAALAVLGPGMVKKQIHESQQMMLGGLLGGSQGLVPGKGPDLAAQQAAQEAAREEAARLQAIADLKEARAQAEAARRRAGDFTPTVEAVVAGPDNRLCVLIGSDLVYEGSEVQSYSIRSIRADAVEFEKGGKVWVQKIQ